MHRVFLIVLLGTWPLINVAKGEEAKKKKVNSATLHIDGEFKEGDQELKFLKDELKNVKGLKRGYQKKAKVYGKLTEESEQLKENFETYIGHRVEYEKAIDGYNKTIECLKSGDALKCRPDKLKKGKRAKRKIKRKARKQPTQASYDDLMLEDDLSLQMSAPMRGSKTKSYDFVSEVDSRISSKSGELLSCYRMGRYSQQGVLKVQMKIAPSGNLSHVGFEDTSQINNPRMVNCVARVLYSLRYPRTPQGKVTTVRKPFVFNLM